MTTFLVCVIVLSFIGEPSIESFVIQYSVYSIIVFVLMAFGMGMSGWKGRIQFEKKKKGLLSFQFGQSNFFQIKMATETFFTLFFSKMFTNLKSKKIGLKEKKGQS